MIVLKYLGKKTGTVLRLPYLSRQYTIEGPGAEIPFTNDDATRMMANNPKMFRVIGVLQDDPAPKPADVARASIRKPAATKPAAEQPPTGAPAGSPDQSPEDILKDDPKDRLPGDFEEPKQKLTGDGVEGTDDDPADKASDKPQTPAAPTVTSAPVSIAMLMTYKVPELRAYAKEQFGHEFGPDDKRNDMIKKIKELEQAKAAQAAS